MLLIFTFNLGGFYAVIWVLKAQANHETSALLDEGHYNEQETFEVKIPLSLPYPVQSDSDYERHSGEFKHEGQVYQVVKQKYENDALIIVCIKDTKATHLEKISNNLVENAGAQTEGSLNLSLKVFQDYISIDQAITNSVTGWSQSIGDTLYKRATYQANLSAIAPPPWA